MAKVKMIEHRPNPKTNVKIGETVYRCSAKGVLMLPEKIEKYNPVIVEEKEAEEKPKTKEG